MIDRLISRLQQAKLELSDQQIAEAIWLAMQMGLPEQGTQQDEALASEQKELPKTNQSSEAGGSDRTQDKKTQTESQKQQSSLSAYAGDSISRSEGGLPFQTPAATALRNATELGRSLRPLMRKVPSHTNFVLDEEATINCIVEQDLWQPVLCPAPERWLDLELVVEASPLSFIWEKPIKEFQHKVLERQGAFRNIRAWTLQDVNPKEPLGKPKLVTRSTGEAIPRSGKPEELVHASGRRLVLLISDCRSKLWRQAPSQQDADPIKFRSPNSLPENLYDWLFYWGSQGSLVLLQLLPEWLWERSAIGLGFNVQLSAILPGVPNSQLVVQGLSQRQRKRANVDRALKLPIITLDAEAISQWAAVVAGAGNAETPGIVFNPDLLRSLLEENQSSEKTAGIGAKELSEAEAERIVDTFLAVASPKAQQLAGMMAAAPVSLPVVHLIQAELLPNSTPVHVAEVYMSGMLEQQGINDKGQPIYEFKPHIRKLLNLAMPTYATEKVLDTLSEAIAKKLNLGGSINSFRAFLEWKSELKQDESDRIVTPFAKILPEVLRNLGGEYAALVENIEEEQPEIATSVYSPISLSSSGSNYSYLNDFVVSASQDRTLKVWDLASGDLLGTLVGHTDWVTAVAIAPDGKFAVSASGDHTLKVWDLSLGKEIQTLTGHTNWVTAVAIAPDGKFAVSASRDNTLKVWDLSLGKEIQTLTGHTNWVTAVAIASDGKFAVSASGDNTLKVWDLSLRKEIQTLTGHTDWVIAVAIAPDGKFAVSASDDKTLKVWDLDSGNELKTLRGRSKSVTAVAIAPDGKLAVSAYLDKTLKVWDLASGEELKTLTGHTDSVTAMAIAPNGKFAVSASDDETLQVWDLSSGEELKTLTGHTDSVTAMAISSGDDKYPQSNVDKGFNGSTSNQLKDKNLPDTESNEFVQKIYDIDIEGMLASLGILVEEMGGDLTGQSAPRNVAVDSIDIEATSRAPISKGAVELGQKVFNQISVEAYKILCTPIGNKDTQEALNKALEENYTKAAGMLAPILVSNLGLAPSVAAIAATLIIKRISQNPAGGIFSSWAKMLSLSETSTMPEELPKL